MENLKTAVFAGGCFWCTEAVFKSLRGVISAVPGYSGGSTANPSYEMVSLGKTGHAEAVKIEYDPKAISYNDLLDVFFGTHDPTTKNRQGNDVGPQYRSVIFYKNKEQQDQSETYLKNVSKKSEPEKPIQTEIKPLTNFYPAEDYHQNYYERHKKNPYCDIVITPKILKIKEKFTNLAKTDAP